jgi:hypothetical protein
MVVMPVVLTLNILGQNDRFVRSELRQTATPEIDTLAKAVASSAARPGQKQSWSNLRPYDAGEIGVGADDNRPVRVGLNRGGR